MDYQLLKWDTDFFAIKIGRIIPLTLSEIQLSTILNSMRAEKYKLVYWAAKSEPQFDTQTHHGMLVDKKTTLEIDLGELVFKSPPEPIVEPFKDSLSFDQLENLAIQSGKHSRFAIDPNFPKGKFINLYKEWIRKSVSGDLADEILISLDGDYITGMVTLTIKDKIGSIGLIAVDKNYRRQKIGQKLVESAIYWFIQQGCYRAEVITQGDNLSACRLYEKCGFQKEKTAFYYHFWL